MTPDPVQSAPEAATPVKPKWLRRLGNVLFIIFCLELGLFLLIFPWTDSWGTNYFAWIGPLKLQPYWHQVWNNSYLRGAISGIGLLNVWVAISDALRMYIGNDKDIER